MCDMCVFTVSPFCRRRRVFSIPQDEPNIARLMGMWSIWMFTVPSLRARECDPKVWIKIDTGARRLTLDA